MSTLRNVIFCDKCNQSIPFGSLHRRSKKNKHLCNKCGSKSDSLRTIGIVLVFLIAFTGGLLSYNNLDFRIDKNTNRIEEVYEHSVTLQGNVEYAFKQVSKWAVRAQDKINKIDESYISQHKSIKKLLENSKAEIKNIRAYQAKLEEKIKNGVLTNEEISVVLGHLKARSDDIEQKLKYLVHSSSQIMDKVIRPTVGIGVDDTKGKKTRGSGVIFKKEDTGRTVKLTGKKIYRYYGLTVYHVWRNIFEYIDDVKSGKRKVDHMKPKLLIYVYDGNTDKAKYLYHGVWVHPTKAIGGPLNNNRDFATFYFDSDRDLATADLASNDEIKNAKVYGRPIISTGIAPHEAPGLWTGFIANPQLRGLGGTAVHTFIFFGQSGGPVFDGMTLKIIGLNQRGHAFRGHISTTILYFVSLDVYRIIFEAEAKKEYRHLLR